MLRGLRYSGGIGILALAMLFAAAGAATGAPRVVATVKPLHSLVAGVMAGVGEPELLLRGAGSPHTYSLRPSEARMLEQAEVIFWVGESLETFLVRPLAVLGAGARVVAAQSAAGARLLPGRAGGSWEAAEAGEDGHHAGDRDAGAELAAGGGTGTLDAHLWLDPGNAKAIVRAAAAALAAADPPNRARYDANAAALASRIDALDAELAAQLAPVRDAPFIVFHDAYQYLERRYALRAVGSIAIGPERLPGARRVAAVRKRIRDLGARCVFGEPQFPSAILGTLLEGTSARAGTLDPLGAELPPGPQAWFALMRGLGASLAGCLR